MVPILHGFETIIERLAKKLTICFYHKIYFYGVFLILIQTQDDIPAAYFGKPTIQPEQNVGSG